MSAPRRRRGVGWWPRAALLVAACGALVCAVVYRSEARRAAVHQRFLEERLARLESELEAAIHQREATTALLASTADARRDRAEGEEGRRIPHLPESVRLVLAAFNECARLDGFDWLRALHGVELADGEVRGVELVERADDGLATTVYLAERMRLVLDRERGAVVVWLHGGHLWSGGERVALPADGRAIELLPVDGPMWEARLARLLQVEGEYPVQAPVTAPAARLDPVERQTWLSRLRQLVESARTEQHYAVQSLRGLQDGEFTEVLLLGYTPERRLQSAIECDRLAVVADPNAERVELLVRGGILRRAGGETTIPDGGYRIVLPGVSSGDASRIMLGMVSSQ